MTFSSHTVLRLHAGVWLAVIFAALLWLVSAITDLGGWWWLVGPALFFVARWAASYLGLVTYIVQGTANGRRLPIQ